MKTGWTIVLLGGLLITACERRQQPPAETQPAAQSQPAAQTQPTGLDDHPATKKDFLAVYVAAVNTNDLDTYKKLIHPKCRMAINDENRLFYDNMFKQDLKYDIPQNYKHSMKQLKPDEPLPFAKMFKYPVRPTLELQLEFEQSPTRSTTIVRQIVIEDGKWWIILPVPNSSMLAKIKVGQAKMEQQKARATELAAKLEDPLLGELKELLKQGRRIDAYKKYSKATGESLVIAKQVIELIEAESKP